MNVSKEAAEMVASGHMTRLEAMKFLKIGATTFDALVKTGQLAYTDLVPGGRRFYRKSVEEFSLKTAVNIPQSDGYVPVSEPAAEPVRRRRRRRTAV